VHNILGDYYGFIGRIREPDIKCLIQSPTIYETHMSEILKSIELVAGQGYFLNREWFRNNPN